MSTIAERHTKLHFRLKREAAMKNQIAQHTSGPWTSFQYPNGEREIGTNWRKVAVMPWAKPMSDEEDIANARLIAAAPELAEALQELYDASPTSCEDNRLNEAQRRAEELLKRICLECAEKD